MSVAFYMDVHVRAPITTGLRLRGVDVLTAQEDGADQLDDDQLLDRAMQLNRVLFSQDKDMLREAAGRQQNRIPFAGLVFARQQRISDRRCIDDLELIAKVDDAADWVDRVVYLPL